MKAITYLLVVTMTAGVLAVGISGCANQQSTTAASNATPGQQTSSSGDLNRTGKRTVGEQLQAADPAVTAQGSGR